MAAILGRVYSIQEHGPGTKAKKKEQTRMYRPCQLDAVQCVVSILITGMDGVGKTEKKNRRECTVSIRWCAVCRFDINHRDGCNRQNEKKNRRRDCTSLVVMDAMLCLVPISHKWIREVGAKKMSFGDLPDMEDAPKSNEKKPLRLLWSVTGAVLKTIRPPHKYIVTWRT